ncbi:hypothetical protein XELAEV_18003163mg [Xenopus laevis]|nr:hypothetical protein XELAEV_18003163mg [Xenopus laevis]
MSIPHSLGLKAIQSIFERIHKPITEQHNFILQALHFVLHHNVFLFNGIYYLQHEGVAMGAKCAPSYANLYLGEWEHYVFSAEEYEMYLGHVLRWHRYINDIMLIWQGPQTITKGIPKGQYLRLRRICSTDEDFKREAYQLYQRFKSRGYKTRCLRRAYQQALSLNREDLLYKFQKRSASSPKEQGETRFILMFNTNDKEIRSLIHKHWNILLKDPTIGQLVPSRPVLL